MNWKLGCSGFDQQGLHRCYRILRKREEATGVTALSPLRIIGTPMLYLGNCQSLEKLVLDDAICGMPLRLVQGIDVNDQTMVFEAIKESWSGRPLSSW